MFWKLVRPGSSIEKAELNADPTVVDAPFASVMLASLFSLLSENLGLRQSANTGESRLGDGTAIPNMSIGLIEYLDGLDLSAFDVLEIGAGLSTEFWAARARSVHALETDSSWARTVQGRNPKAVVQLAANPAERMGELHRKFGIIVIDPAANRYLCAKAAVPMLEPGGFIILDNSEWYPNASRVLREAGLIEVDFHDFRHAHHFRTTSSIYLHPEFRPVPKSGRLPRPPIGGKPSPNDIWDKES